MTKALTAAGITRRRVSLGGEGGANAASAPSRSLAE